MYDIFRHHYAAIVRIILEIEGFYRIDDVVFVSFPIHHIHAMIRKIHTRAPFIGVRVRLVRSVIGVVYSDVKVFSFINAVRRRIA